MCVARQRAASDSLNLVTSVPATATDPASGRSIPAIRFSSVVLPDPRGHQAEELPFGHVERDVAQHGNRHAVASIGLGNTADLHDRIGH